MIPTSQKNSFPLNPQNQEIQETSSELLILTYLSEIWYKAYTNENLVSKFKEQQVLWNIVNADYCRWLLMTNVYQSESLRQSIKLNGIS